MFYNHEKNIEEIKNFLNELKVDYQITNTGTVYGEPSVFDIPAFNLQLRYVDSYKYKKDYSTRFGIVGIKSGYFINISKRNAENGIRTIWLKDWEVEGTFNAELHSTQTITESVNTKGVVKRKIENTTTENYPRKWEVLKSYIRTACGNIQTRVYARDTEIVILPNNEVRAFLNENCFYGHRNSNLNVCLVMKKDKGELKKGQLVFVYTFGFPYFGSGKYDIEVIRVASRLNTQILGGASKCLKHFIVNHPTLNISGREVDCERIVFLVDSDHNDSRSLVTLGFEFVSWEGAGFMNMYTDTGEVFMRKPQIHKQIMADMAAGKIISVENAGTAVYMIKRSEYMKGLKNIGAPTES